MGECEGIHGWATVVLRGLSSDAVFIVSGSSVREDSTTSEAGRDQWPGLWVFVMLKPSEVLQEEVLVREFLLGLGLACIAHARAGAPVWGPGVAVAADVGVWAAGDGSVGSSPGVGEGGTCCSSFFEERVSRQCLLLLQGRRAEGPGFRPVGTVGTLSSGCCRFLWWWRGLLGSSCSPFPA